MSARRTLSVSEVTHFGRTEFRPECPESRFLAELLGRVNLTEANLERAREYGYEIKVIKTEAKGKI
jgi:hypothetical protein